MYNCSLLGYTFPSMVKKVGINNKDGYIDDM